jgi:hypothetical protein
MDARGAESRGRLRVSMIEEQRSATRRARPCPVRSWTEVALELPARRADECDWVFVGDVGLHERFIHPLVRPHHSWVVQARLDPSSPTAELVVGLVVSVLAVADQEASRSSAWEVGEAGSAA